MMVNTCNHLICQETEAHEMALDVSMVREEMSL